MAIVTITRRQVELTHGADAWELYDEPRRDEVAREINGAIASAFNAGADRAGVARAGHRSLLAHADCGAADSEGLATLDRIVEELFA